MPRLLADYPGGRWVFLTLTVRNCEASHLARTYRDMHTAWRRLVQRKRFKQVVLGWVRCFEVTRDSRGLFHPHYHCLLFVAPSYFGGTGYIKQEEWVRLWAESLKVDYLPSVHVKAVKKAPSGREALQDPLEGLSALRGALQEVFKVFAYGLKPNKDGLDDDFVVQITNILHGAHYIATGGVIKTYVKPVEDDDDLLTDEHSDSLLIGDDVVAHWDPVTRRYRIYEELQSSTFD